MILLIGSFLQGIAGFGSGLLAMGLIPLVLTVKESTLLLLAVTVVMSVHILVVHRGHIRLREIAWILSATIVSRIPAFFVLDEFGTAVQMKRILGVVLVLVAAWLWLNSAKTHEAQAAWLGRPAAAVTIGFVGGFTGGLFAVGGPLLALYFLYLYKDKRKYIANLQLTYMIANLLTLGLHGMNGDIHAKWMLIFMFGAAASWLGVYLGTKFFGRLPASTIRKLALGIVMLSGMNLLLFAGG